MKVLKNLQSIARSVLLAEAEAVRCAVDRLDGQFDATVAAILECRGRVVITGLVKAR